MAAAVAGHAVLANAPLAASVFAVVDTVLM
jgi:hypothetical protein